MKKICIVLVATNYYFPLGLRFINRWSHLYNGEIETEFHFYSEKDPSEYIDSTLSNVLFHKMETTSWSEADVSRIYEIVKMDDHETDYIYVFDADTNIDFKFNDYLFKDGIVAYQHLYNDLFDTNKEAKNYFEVTPSDIWYQTCLIGGSKKDMVAMCKAVVPWISIDQENGYTPQWIAERYFNRYLHENKPSYYIKRGQPTPFYMSDKGDKSKEIMGIDQLPFFDMPEGWYELLLENIKKNKLNLWNISDNKFVIEDSNNISTFIWRD